MIEQTQLAKRKQALELVEKGVECARNELFIEAVSYWENALEMLPGFSPAKQCGALLESFLDLIEAGGHPPFPDFEPFLNPSPDRPPRSAAVSQAVIPEDSLEFDALLDEWEQFELLEADEAPEADVLNESIGEIADDIGAISGLDDTMASDSLGQLEEESEPGDSESAPQEEDEAFHSPSLPQTAPRSQSSDMGMGDSAWYESADFTNDDFEFPEDVNFRNADSIALQNNFQVPGNPVVEDGTEDAEVQTEAPEPVLLSLDLKPKLAVDPGELTQFDISPTEAFVLSQLDGVLRGSEHLEIVQVPRKQMLEILREFTRRQLIHWDD